jgi:hypothetical protein
MSASNAAARKRRAPQNETIPPQNNIRQPSVTPNVNQTGLTLPQVIHIIDNRLIKLETFMKESSTTISESVTPGEQNDNINKSAHVEQWINEFNNRFEILAEEIGNLKDIVLKLQSYTMNVNKTLLEERINIFSDLTNNNPKENIVLETINNNNNNNNNNNSISTLELHTLVSEEIKNI